MTIAGSWVESTSRTSLRGLTAWARLVRMRSDKRPSCRSEPLPTGCSLNNTLRAGSTARNVKSASSRSSLTSVAFELGAYRIPYRQSFAGTAMLPWCWMLVTG